MAQADVQEIEDGKPKAKRRFDARDWDYIAQYVIDEYERRKNARSDLEKCWADIDRQIAMKPEVSFKRLPNGQVDVKKAWMAETELPLQAQALEVLTADTRRMLFPDNGAWFRAHAEMSDEYLAKADFKSMILGDEAEVPSKINQDNADKLVEGFLMHLFRQQVKDEDYFTRQDRINAESFKYAVGVGRARIENKSLYITTPRGVRREQRKVPVLVPVSIKNLFLDDPGPSTHSAQSMEPAHILRDYIKHENLILAANKGSDDPDDPDGGWMPQNTRKLVPDDKGFVTLLEMEGDIIVPRKTVRSVVIPGAIVTVALGGKDSGGAVSNCVVRFRFRKYPTSSYLLFPYHYEGADDIYATSPLMKGRPLQILATDIANRLLDGAALKNMPPVSYDATNSAVALAGGPEIYPGALWGGYDQASIKAHTEIGGDPAALAAMLSQTISLYAELTGVLPSRLGAQTVSHTTAFAKDAELQRGATRTVDFVRQVGHGALTRWLGLAYQMGRDSLGSREPASFFIDAYGGYVEVTKDQLPERATFDWFGSGGPAEEQAKRQMRLQSLTMAFQVDQAGVQLGKQPKIDLDKAIEQILREGGWTDVDAITMTPNTAVPALPAPLRIAALQEVPGEVVG